MRETPWWTWHLIAGAVILVFLGLHMLIMHLDMLVGFMNPAGTEAIDWDNIIYRAQQAFFPLTYIVLLGAALYHGLYGTRVLLLELNPGQGLRTFINVALWTIGLALFALGATANLVVLSQHLG
jgi:succinate dehydrogenase / fumarate reductase membrane anchor subunit